MHFSVPAEIELTDAEFLQVSAVAEAHFGLSLPPEKRLLVARRIRGPIVAAGCADFRSWAAVHLREPLAPALLSELANALTTNHTYFWREPSHFVHFRDVVLPERVHAHQHDRDLRVWCAAASSGEEPYQLAMVLRDVVGGSGWKAGLLATDLSSKVLEFARAGVYPTDRLRALPEAWRNKYVQINPDGAGVMVPALRADITFRRLNLLQQPWRFRQPFDVIFCRNVLIYFEHPVRDRVVTEMVRWLTPGGVLYVGHAEALPRKFGLEPIGAGVWRKGA